MDGINFHSKGEAERYLDLKLLEHHGSIACLKLQPRMPIVVNDEKICTYVGDFRYDENGLDVIEDFKGVETQVFKIKWKLVKALYPDLTFKITRSPRGKR